MACLCVNLPLRRLAARPGDLDVVAAAGLAPEIGLDAGALDRFDDAFLAATAARCRELGVVPSVHLPFIDLQPGARDPLILMASRTRLARAFAAAKILQPRHLVGHASCPLAVTREELGIWLANAAETWGTLCDGWPGHPPLFLENTFRPDAEDVALLVDALDGHDVGACFDVGHWHSFSGGADKKDLRAWLARLGKRLRHLHLHDNSGAGDEHLGLGQGVIDFDLLFDELDRLGVTPTATLEPHSVEDLRHSLAYIAAHRDRFAALCGDAGLPVAALPEIPGR